MRNPNIPKTADELIAGDMIITTFWSHPEVCKVLSTISGKEVVIVRLESIVDHKNVKKDYCSATIPEHLLARFPFKFLHRSKWYTFLDWHCKSKDGMYTCGQCGRITHETLAIDTWTIEDGKFKCLKCQGKIK